MNFSGITWVQCLKTGVSCPSKVQSSWIGLIKISDLLKIWSNTLVKIQERFKDQDGDGWHIIKLQKNLSSIQQQIKTDLVIKDLILFLFSLLIFGSMLITLTIIMIDLNSWQKFGKLSIGKRFILDSFILSMTNKV